MVWRIGSTIMSPTASRAPTMTQPRARQTCSAPAGCTTWTARGTGSAEVGCSVVAVLISCSVIVGTIHLHHVAGLSSRIPHCTVSSISTSRPLLRCHHQHNNTLTRVLRHCWGRAVVYCERARSMGCHMPYCASKCTLCLHGPHRRIRTFCIGALAQLWWEDCRRRRGPCSEPARRMRACA